MIFELQKAMKSIDLKTYFLLWKALKSIDYLHFTHKMKSYCSI